MKTKIQTPSPKLISLFAGLLLTLSVNAAHPSHEGGILLLVPLDTEPTEEQIGQATAEVAGAQTASDWTSAENQAAAEGTTVNSADRIEWGQLEAISQSSLHSQNNTVYLEDSHMILPPTGLNPNHQFVFHNEVKKPDCEIQFHRTLKSGNIAKLLAPFVFKDNEITVQAIMDLYIISVPNTINIHYRSYGLPVTSWQASFASEFGKRSVLLEDKDTGGEKASIRVGFFLDVFFVNKKKLVTWRWIGSSAYNGEGLS